MRGRAENWIVKRKEIESQALGLSNSKPACLLSSCPIVAPLSYQGLSISLPGAGCACHRPGVIASALIARPLAHHANAENKSAVISN